jgi:putative NADH-flavin reductase
LAVQAVEIALGTFPLGLKLIDAPNFPEAYKQEATARCAFLDQLRAETELDWTFLSPPAMFVPGERTGKFRLGTDLLLSNEHGSSISLEDYAVALVGKLENPVHSRNRFTFGY